MLYVDRADDAGFTLNVVSDLVPQGTAEYTDVTLAAGAKPFYRIRAVNASGSSVSGIVVPTAGNVFGGGRHPSGYRGGYRGGGRDDDRMRHKF